MVETTGIHHVTAIAGDPTRNAAFYVETLGLRFVKRTVNHDDTGTYHFYFGDGRGTPGTTITFFPWGETGRPGRFGAGQARRTLFSVPAEGIDYWTERLTDAGVDVERGDRFGRPTLAFADPDGIRLGLVAHEAERPGVHWADGPVPADRAIRGFYGVELAVADAEPTAGTLTGVGFERTEAADGAVRFDTGAEGIGTVVDLVETDAERGTMGAGTVHHVAFRVADEDEQAAMRERLAALGLSPTEIIDRTYFRSIYARDPGGVLFEFATLGPGFDVDEPVEALGERLALPEWLEPERAEIEERLPAFDPPRVGDDRE